MRAFTERVIATIDRHRMFATGQRVGVAVSGGADSMCLLHLLHELAPRWNLHLSVVHIEHGIRGAESRQDAEFVRLVAAKFGLPFHLHAADVPAMEHNLEQAARDTRQQFYRRLIASGQLDRIATGHTASDQAETVLYRVLRGSGLAGLSGIRPVTQDGFVRPLIDTWRTEVETWLRERNIGWRLDASNHDLSFARNRLRHQTLPMLRQTFNPNLDKILAHMAVLAQDDESYWNNIILADTGSRCAGVAVLPVHDLAKGAPALTRRQIRRAIEGVKGNLRQIDFSHVELVLEMARAKVGHGRAHLPGIEVLRSFDWIRIAPEGFDNNVDSDFEVAVAVPASVSLPSGGRTVTLELIEPEYSRDSYDRVGDELDWQRLVSFSAPEARNECGIQADQFELRNWRPGDQYCPSGQSRERKIKTLFQEARIPLWERRLWPVLTCAGKILWARRFGSAAEFAATPGSGPVLRIRETSQGLESIPR